VHACTAGSSRDIDRSGQLLATEYFLRGSISDPRARQEARCLVSSLVGRSQTIEGSEGRGRAARGPREGTTRAATRPAGKWHSPMALYSIDEDRWTSLRDNDIRRPPLFPRACQVRSRLAPLPPSANATAVTSAGRQRERERERYVRSKAL